MFYTFPYLGIIFLPMAIIYYIISIYYRRSSVETKRLDSRFFMDHIQVIFSYSQCWILLICTIRETLTGLSTIRAHREQAGRFILWFLFLAQNRCVKEAEHGIDMENRAYLITISMQQWLAVQLDLFGNALVLGIGFFAAGFRTTVNPAKIGVVLSYTLASRFIHNFIVCLLIFFFLLLSDSNSVWVMIWFRFWRG